MSAIKTSKEEIEKSETCRSILWQLSLALNIAHFYREAEGLRHPSIESKIKDWFELLASYLEDHNKVLIEEVKGDLYIDGIKFVPKAVVLQKLLQNFLDYKIGSIKVKQGVSYEELHRFFTFLVIELEKIEDIDAASQAFADLHLEHIEIVHAEYMKVSETQRVASKQTDQAAKEKGLDKANIDQMIQFLQSYRGTKHKVPATWVQSIIKDPQKAGQLILLIADNDKSKKELGITGEWHEVVTAFLWAVSNYLLEQVDKGKSSKTTIKYLETVQKVIEEKMPEKKLAPDKVDHLKNNFAHMKRAVTLDGLWADWIKEGKKLDKLADQIIKELESLDKSSEAYKAFVDKIKAAKRPGENIFELL